MAEKGQRAVTKLIPRLSAGAKHEVCKVSSDLLEDLSRTMVRQIRIADFESLRNTANEAIFLARMRANCRTGGN